MAAPINEVHRGDPITASGQNQLIRSVNKLNRIRSDGTIRVIEDSAGILLSAALPPQPFFFKLTQDTPKNQGYVTARSLIWIQASNSYQTIDTEPEFKVYDRLSGLDYGGIVDNSSRAPSQWTKKNFVGRASWASDKGQWQIEWIEHVARFINFTLTAALASGATTAQGTAGNSWDGLPPNAGSSKITLLTSPTGSWKASSGAKGTAVWRNDLDNSTEWQYQIIDLNCA